MSAVEEHCAIQVVKVKNDHTYRLDEAALKQILLRDDVKDLPVVVASVAGAYRGGKSFLLDFFLKYLNAPESYRGGREWLGNDDEPLEGFRWRGGCDRETTGIHLWSDPVVVNYRGEKVVVLLMDTQGTFDSSSTVRDCSTIFALSTLLSSVQIYNLKENIKEDDLQHLHLFVEYGKLAQKQDETAFQLLTFLVRDWPYPYQHPYGAAGGEQLLAKRLEISAGHTEDMRNLRTSIRSFFQSVKSFLMPHPGFAVAEPEFDGRLSSIREEFKTSLLELVPSIFGSENLTPKTISGQQVKCGDLFYYFQTYMNIFNSNELPEPVTIMKATSEAALMSAERSAREAYAAAMEARCGPHRPSAPRADLRREHRRALQHATQVFNAKKKMGPQNDIDEYLNRILADLESRLASYEALNEAKLNSAIAEANKAYEETILEVCGDKVLCLHPEDLGVLHIKALTTALEKFDTLRVSSDIDDDEDRCALLQKLESNITSLRNKNDQNNMGFVAKAQDKYTMFLANSNEEGSFLSEQLLRQRHGEAKDSALDLFRSMRNMDHDDTDDPYIDILLKNIMSQFKKNMLINKNANRTAIQAAQHTYSNYMTSKWSPQVYCLHPEDLVKVHRDAVKVSLQEFMSNRTSADDEEDSDKQNLVKILEEQYSEFKGINEANNERAVEEAHNHYCRKMESNCKPSLLSILILPWVAKVLKLFPEFHATAKREAINLFKSRRREIHSYDCDEYFDRLVHKLNQGYDDYCNPLRALAREFGLPVN